MKLNKHLSYCSANIYDIIVYQFRRVEGLERSVDMLETAKAELQAELQDERAKVCIFICDHLQECIVYFL